MSTFNREQLRQGALLLGITLEEKQIDQFQEFSKLLGRANEQLNLTRVPPDEFIARHVLDSLLVCKAFDPNIAKEGLDVGTGGGFPGVPLAIAFPSMRWLLIDSSMKKIRFIGEAKEQLGLSNIRTLGESAESLARQSRFQGAFDLVTARAVTSLEKLIPLLTPFIRPQGTVVALKEDAIEDELDLGRRKLPTVQIVDGTPLNESCRHLLEIQKVELPQTGIVRSLVRVLPRSDSV